MEDVWWDSIYIASTPAFLISVVFLIGGSLLTQKLDPPKVLTDLYGKPVDMRNPYGWSKVKEEEEEVVVEPSPVPGD